MINIIGVGDIMPGGILSGVNQGYISNDIIKLLESADIRIGTLETAIGNNPRFYEEKMSRKADVIHTLDQDLSKLSDLNINIVSLANNHFFDLGPEGAYHAIELLEKLGIEHIGAGYNIKDASKAVIKYINGESIAFLAFCDWRDETVGWCPFATETTPGVNPMYDDYVVSEISRYKSKYDYVVVMPHWGREHTYMTTNHVYRMARLMIKAGADLILGSHPHRVQPVINQGGTSIAYSMGNFLFPNRLIAPPRSTYYSEEEININTLPSTDEYPFVEEITYKRWTPLALIGMIVSSQLKDKKAYSTYHLTEMSERGYISLNVSRRIDRHLSLHRFLLKYTPYELTYFTYRVLRAIAHRSKRLINKMFIS